MKRQPPPPPSRSATVRSQLLDQLLAGPVTVRDLSVALGLPEKEIYPHLEHLQRSLRPGRRHLVVRPAVCRKCDFVFRKRTRLRPPGRCPVCRNESIEPPLFSVKENR